jgi:hypothetical protein
MREITIASFDISWGRFVDRTVAMWMAVAMVVHMRVPVVIEEVRLLARLHV